MNLNVLFEKQAELDQYICEKQNIKTEEIFKKKITAFIVELSELANEIQFFKYWKNEVVVDHQKAVEEYIDVIHFSISLSNDLGIHDFEYNPTEIQDFTTIFIGLTNLATVLSLSKDKEHAKKLLNNVIALGYQLGLTEDRVIEEYNKKNEVNYERQKAGY